MKTKGTIGDFRDEDLGAALRSLDTPEHDPDFFARLEATLEAAPGAADRRGASAAAAGRTTREKPKRRWWRLVLVPIPVAALILVLVWVFGVGPSSVTPPPLTAAEVQAQVNATLTSLRTVRGTMVVVSYEEGEAAEMRWTFAATAHGDFRLSGVSRREELAYDATRGVSQSLSWEEGSVFAGRSTGLAAGLPDPGPRDWVLQRELGSVVRAMLAAEAAGVARLQYEGRPAWSFSTDVQANRISGVEGDHLDIIVDQATGFPVKAVETKAGEPVREIRLEGLELDPQLPADAFQLQFPKEAELSAQDFGFQRVTLEEAEPIVGYAPLLPLRLPAGYQLAEVTVAEVGQATGKEGMNPVSRGVVSVAFRRGFDRVVVSTRLVGADPSSWEDPLAMGEGYIDLPEDLVLAEGGFAGAPAELLIDPRATPHIWARGEELVMTIAGDLSREELVTAAESMAQWNAR